MDLFLDVSKFDISKLQNPILPAVNADGSTLVTGGGGYGVQTVSPIATTPQTPGWMSLIQQGLGLAASAYNASIQPVQHPTTAPAATPGAGSSITNVNNLPYLLLGAAALALVGAVVLARKRGR